MNLLEDFLCCEILYKSTLQEDGCLIYTGAKNKAGYGYIKFRQRTYLVHRYIGLTRVGIEYTFGNKKYPSDQVVIHICNNPSCVNPNHLKVTTQAENIQQAFREERKSASIISMPGEKNPNVVLTEDMVRKIRNAYAAGGVTHRQLAFLVGVNRTAITKIINKQIWAHI